MSKGISDREKHTHFTIHMRSWYVDYYRISNTQDEDV